MKYKIMIHPMPESCDECPCHNTAYEGTECKLGAWVDDIFNHINMYDGFESFEGSRHKNCPLIPAEPWQFESCDTCNGYSAKATAGTCLLPHTKGINICDCWTPKKGEQNESNN